MAQALIPPRPLRATVWITAAAVGPVVALVAAERGGIVVNLILPVTAGG